ELPLDLLIQRLAAYNGLSKTEQLTDEIEQLESHPEAGQYRSQLLLWRGYAFLTDDSQQVDARSLIQQAIEGNLSTEDRLFAEGLIADSLDQAVDKFNSALELAPFHPQARMQLVVTLTLLGRYDEIQQQVEYGKTLFVDDPRYYFAQTVSHALANDSQSAIDTVKDIRERFPRANTTNARAINRVSSAVNKQFRVYDESGLLDWIPIIRQGLPMFQQRSYEAIPIPEFQKVRIFTAYGEFAQSFLNPLMAIARPRKKHQLIICNCQKAYERHPDGLFKCFEAWSWFALGNYEKSAEAFQLAADSDGLFPEIKNQALYGAFLSRVKQCESDASANVDKVGEAVNYLEQYAALDFEPHRALPMFKASCMAGRWDLARHICDTMIKKGDPPQKWYPLLIDEAVDRENAALALVTCEHLMELMPNDPKCEARHREIVEIIVEQGNDR
ncbi:MAG: hypothetical protein ACR2NP_19670, partial [Pirellulaceae bacterium]